MDRIIIVRDIVATRALEINCFSTTDDRISCCISLQIKREDVDFHQYYSNGRQEELKDRMDKKLYPPRCKARVKANNKSFFITSMKKISIQVTCKAKCIDGGNIDIPCIKNGMDIINILDSIINFNF